MPKTISEMSDSELEESIDQLRKSARFSQLESQASVRVKSSRNPQEGVGGGEEGPVPRPKSKRSRRSSVFDQLGLGPAAGPDDDKEGGRGY